MVQLWSKSQDQAIYYTGLFSSLISQWLAYASIYVAMLEEALTEHDAEGVYYDLLLFLLGAILRTHLEEEEEEGLDGSHDHEPLVDVDDEGDEKSQSTVSASAIMAAAWPMQYQGKPLHELIMDPFTSSELLRLHLLSSGARIGMSELQSVAFQHPASQGVYFL